MTGIFLKDFGSLNFFLILSLAAVLSCNVFSKSGFTNSFPSDSLENTSKKNTETQPGDIEKASGLKWYSMITNVPGDWVSFGNKYADKEYLAMYAFLTVSTAYLIVKDPETWNYSDRLYNKTTFNRRFSDFFTEFGDGRSQFAFAACFALGGWIGNDERAWRTSSQIVEGVLACGGFVQVLKHMTGRESPFISTKAGGAWRWFPNQIDYHKHVPAYDAYPSGHIATSMAAFIIIADNYPEYKWLEPTGWILATCIGIGMANQGIHWYSDYPLGLALGYGFGKIVTRGNSIINPKYGENKKVDISLLPYISSFSNGIMFNVNF